MKIGYMMMVFLLLSTALLAVDTMDKETDDFLNQFLQQDKNNHGEILQIKEMFLEELASEKIPLSVVQFVAKMMDRKRDFNSPAQAADYLLKIIDETDMMLRRGYNPARIRALVRQTTENRDIAAEEIKKRIQNRLHKEQENLEKQNRREQNDRGEHKATSDHAGYRYGKEGDTASPGPRQRKF